MGKRDESYMGFFKKGSVETLGINNVFLFQFGSQEDRHLILIRSPWNFEKQVLSLTKPLGIGDVSSMKFNWVPFWIHILNASLACMNESSAHLWDNLMG